MIIRRGTSIVEIVIATALISISVIAALSLANHTQKQSTYSRNLAEAGKYASQATDWIRNERNTIGWASISAKAISDDSSGQTTYCLNTLTTGETSFADIESGDCLEGSYIASTFFTRKMIIDTSNSASGVLTVKVIISWEEKITRSITIETELDSWH